MHDHNFNSSSSDNSERVRPPRLIRLPEVMDRVGLRRTAVYERVKEGEFPKPRSLGPRCSVWVESEIDEWVNRVIDDGRS
ncbi:MAG: AlpA family transcriptional regulator [Pseudomonadota bacterium]